MSTPAFPPLMSGLAVSGAIDPFEKACAMASLGCDAGLIVHNITANRLLAALVMAPEVPLEEAMAMLPACGVGFQNALGALAPPEVAVHLEWPGGIRINGAACGHFRVAAGGSDPAALPGWLVVGIDLPLMQINERPGDRPDQTALYDEGCAEVDPVALLESWARHTLVWINRWEEDGGKDLHSEWRPLAHDMGEDVRQNGIAGKFLGVDERFGMLLRDNDTTHLIPLSTLLESPQ
ncbi:Biotin-(acetyl-CoA carboxylase) ligase [Roseovarius marisflavi]|uniref:Biotin-(Acetyl-CoA carboxylase) ligase n=1 Tax=Roseovarius marisflavi TaxID=1054996 RepID=A0A1M6W620_9RHOB|nr:biotin/lipoate--protein ligase family protein [Roseovarius marisflavi]SHK89119.1 Biotin-(acetyl-CoA carboxylase) ligase [Roseovarius marisflavi]